MRRMTVTLPQMMVAIPTMMLVLAMAVMMMMMVRTCHGVGDDDTDSMLVGTRK